MLQTVQALQKFNQQAIANKLSGVQMQLWQSIYWLAETYGQDLCIPTYHFLETLEISRSQFSRARNALEQAGFLRIRKNGAQRTHYTVLLDGVEIEYENTTEPRRNNKKSATNSTAKPLNTKSTEKPKVKQQGPSIPTGVAPQKDIVMNHEIRKEAEAFVEAHGYSRLLRNKLLAWCDMRQNNHWTMTSVGFAGTMKTLLEYGGGDEELMIKIIDRTLTHGWKGFYPYKVDAAPSGKAMKTPYNSNTAGKIPKYDTKKEDLDFLEW